MNAIKKLTGILLALLCVLCAAGIAFAAVPSEILINQFEQNADEVTIYLNMMDENGLSFAGAYAPADFAVNVSGSRDFTPDSVSTADNSGTPTLYALGFDIGKNELTDVRDAVYDLINSKKPQDRVMLVKLGDELNYVQQPTQDITQLHNALGLLDQSCTSTYQGIQQFMLDTAAARQQGERVVMILFTDGLDDNSGTVNEWQGLNTITQIRLPVYTIGLKNTSNEEKFGYFDRMAGYSGTRVFTENDGSVMNSLQAIRRLAGETTVLKLHLPYEYFTNPSTIMWKVSCMAEGQTISSNPCSYTLTTEGVSEPTPTPAPATPTPEPIVTPTPTPEKQDNLDGQRGEEKNDDRSIGELLKRKEVQIVLIAAAALIVLIIVVIIITSRAARKRRVENEPSGSVDHIYRPGNVILVDRPQEISIKDAPATQDVVQVVSEDVEKTYNPYAESEEATVNPYSEEEKTLAPVYDPPVQIRFDVDTREEPPFVKEVSFTDEMMIGRHKDCQLVLSPRYVSRYHFKLTKTEQGVFIYNQKPEDTAKYVMLNRVPLGDKECQIHDGDLLEISRTQVKIHILSDAEGKKD